MKQLDKGPKGMNWEISIVCFLQVCILQKYTAILYTKTSHKLFIMQLLLKKESFKETLKC